MEFPEKFNTTADIKIPEKLIDQVIGQEKAVEVAKLVAKHRRHLLLLGEPGTGKTAIVEGLALRIINKDVPENLKNKKLISLDIGSLLLVQNLEENLKKD